MSIEGPWDGGAHDGGWPAEPWDTAEPVDAGTVASELLDHWTQLRRGRPMPARSDLDARDLGRSLAHVFVLERSAPGIARFLIAGRHLNRMMGLSVRGMPMTVFAAPGERGRLLELTDAVFDTPAIVELGLEASRTGMPPLRAEMILLPLTDRHGAVTRAVGSLAAQTPLRFSPSRFRVTAERLSPIVHRAGAPNWRPGPVPWLRIVK